MELGFGFTTIVIIIVGLYLLSSIKILAEYERGVIFRLGRLLPQAKGPGLIFVFAPLGLPAWYWLLASRILGVPLIAGLSYEVIKFAGKHRRKRCTSSRGSELSPQSWPA